MLKAKDGVEAEALVKRLKALGKKMVAAESCTAGLIANAIAAVPGASEVFWGSFVVYTPEAKSAMLKVEANLIRAFGAVSMEVARAMALEALNISGVDFAVSVTGLAGPDGDGSQTPVGTVCIGLARPGESPKSLSVRFSGKRNLVRLYAANLALEELLKYIG
ncbi:MAG: CinA family protein [Treponema sp.]|jgi:PncC family amidohydrolase|nr:CinA family protein [Treponema sp.]